VLPAMGVMVLIIVAGILVGKFCFPAIHAMVMRYKQKPRLSYTITFAMECALWGVTFFSLDAPKVSLQDNPFRARKILAEWLPGFDRLDNRDSKWWSEFQIEDRAPKPDPVEFTSGGSNYPSLYGDNYGHYGHSGGNTFTYFDGVNSSVTAHGGGGGTVEVEHIRPLTPTLEDKLSDPEQVKNMTCNEIREALRPIFDLAEKEERILTDAEVSIVDVLIKAYDKKEYAESGNYRQSKKYQEAMIRATTSDYSW
jgi:hypothetical protein